MRNQKVIWKIPPVFSILVASALFSQVSYGQKAKGKTIAPPAPALTSAGVSDAIINAALDEAGNSVKAQLAIKYVVEKLKADT